MTTTSATSSSPRAIWMNGRRDRDTAASPPGARAAIATTNAAKNQ